MILIILQNPKHTISTTTIVEPTGVPETIATNKPIIAITIDINPSTFNSLFTLLTSKNIY